MKERKSRQGFSEDVCKIIFTRNKMNTLISMQKFLTNIIKIDFHMLCARVKNQISR